MGLPSFLCDAFYNASAGAYFCTSDPFLVNGDTDDNLNSATGVDYNELGQATEMRFPAGGGLWRHNLYYAWDDTAWGGFSNSDRNRRLAEIRVGTSTNVTSGADSHNRLRLRHFYDSHGNLDVLHEQYNGSSTIDTHSFAYDDQNRLTAGFGSNTFTYDSSGRLEFFEDEDYTPLSNAFPVHAVKGSDYAYDANGNMTSRPNYTLSWDHENRLASVTGGGIYPSEDYLYDADGMRVKKTSDGAETYYPFPHYELHDGVVVKYYFFNGMRVAQRRGSSTITYLHGNHLGSTVLETSVIGVSVNDEKYFAYGEQRDTGPVNTENQFTDQKRDETGLYYYGARYYDPALGTFISPDTIVPNASHVFGYNRFMYTYGNPLMYTDPSGHYGICFNEGTFAGEEKGNNAAPSTVVSTLCGSLAEDGFFGESGRYGVFGSGRSGADAALEFLTEMQTEYPDERFVLVGFSYGGAAALEFARLVESNHIARFLGEGPSVGISHSGPTATVSALVTIDPVFSARVPGFRQITPALLNIGLPTNVRSAYNILAEQDAYAYTPFDQGREIPGATNHVLPKTNHCTVGNATCSARDWAPIPVNRGPVNLATQSLIVNYLGRTFGGGPLPSGGAFP